MSEHQLHTVAFTSGKGGCGKTTLAVNFAHNVFQATKKVILVDFDLSNRGSTGIFSHWTAGKKGYLTLTQLIRDDNLQEDDFNSLLQIKEGFYLIPASSPDEEEWTEPKNVSLKDFVNPLRDKFQRLSGFHHVPCVVLDCFCGVDILTTAGAALANDTVLVNEPDIVTFTGALNLLNHLKRSLAKLERQPSIHFVVNRVKSNQTIKELTLLYRKNLEEEVNEVVLAHFPYNERLFKNFGRYPFFAELLPGSLFVRKIELLSYFLFKDNSPHLLKPKVNRWSSSKVKRIYNRSIDGASVDSEYLILKLTSFPILAGAWFIVYMFTAWIFPLTPVIVWLTVMVIGTALGYLLVVKLLYGLWLSARLNFTIAEFNFRLGNRIHANVNRTKRSLYSVMPFLSSVFMGITVAVLALYLVTALVFCGEWLFDKDRNYYFTEEMLEKRGDNSYMQNLKNTRMVDVALSLPMRALDLRDYEVQNIDFLDYSFDGTTDDLKSRREIEPGRILIGNTTFKYCIFNRNVLNGSSFSNYSFINCLYKKKDPYEDYDIYYEYENDLSTWIDPFEEFYQDLKKYKIRDKYNEYVQIIKETDWNNVQLKGFPLNKVIIFDNCTFDNVQIQVDDGKYLVFSNCTFKENCSIGFTEGSIGHYKLHMDNSTFVGEMQIEGHPDQISDKHYLSSMNSYFNLIELKEDITITESSVVASLQDDSTRILYTLELVELYILTNEGDYLDKAEKLLYSELAEENFPDEHYNIGTRRLLVLLMHIMKNHPPEQYELELLDWKDWLAQYGNLEWYWSWNVWDEYILDISLNASQKVSLEYVRASAKGEEIPSMKKFKSYL